MALGTMSLHLVSAGLSPLAPTSFLHPLHHNPGSTRLEHGGELITTIALGLRAPAWRR